MRLLAASALGALLVALTIAALATPAAAVAPTAVGWWWEAEQGAPVPPPPTVPSDGFMVGGDPSGANAVAALHFALAGDDSAPVLTLAVADNGNVNGASDVMVACPSATPWKPAAPGNWSDKPAPRCDKNVKGTLSPDSKTMTFALSSLVSSDGSTLDIVLIPAAGASFELTFNAPSATSLSTTKVAPGSTSDSASSSDTSSGLSTPSDISTADAPSDTSALLTAPYASTLAPPADTPTQQITTVRPSTPVNGADNVVGASPARRAPGVAVLLLMMVAGAAWAAGRSPIPGLRRLGPMSTSPPPAAAAREPAGEPAVGGLGRFARERRGAPPKL